MKVKVVDETEQYPLLICEGMSTKKMQYFKGYIPHFNIHGEGTEMRLAKIPENAFGVRQSFNIFGGAD